MGSLNEIGANSKHFAHQLTTLSQQPLNPPDLTSPVGATSSQENYKKVLSPMSLAALDSHGGISSGRYITRNDESNGPMGSQIAVPQVMMEKLGKHEMMSRP